MISLRYGGRAQRSAEVDVAAWAAASAGIGADAEHLGAAAPLPIHDALQRRGILVRNRRLAVACGEDRAGSGVGLAPENRFGPRPWPDRGWRDQREVALGHDASCPGSGADVRHSRDAAVGVLVPGATTAGGTRAPAGTS